MRSLRFVRFGLLVVFVLAAGGCDDHPLTPLACRPFISVGVGEPDSEPAIWRWDVEHGTKLRTVPEYVRWQLDSERHRMALVFEREIHIVSLQDDAEQVIDYQGDFANIDWWADTMAVIVGRSDAPPAWLYRIDVVTPSTGERKTVVPESSSEITAIHVSPDGKKLGFVRDSQLLQVASAGGTPTPIVPDAEPMWWFYGWSASGDYVAYFTEARQLRIVELATGTTTYSLDNYAPGGIWAPVGDRLMIQESTPSGAHGDYKVSLSVMDADGVNGRYLDYAQLSREIPNRLPTWSLDGQEIAWHPAPVKKLEDAGPNPLVATHVITGDTVVVNHDWPEEAYLTQPCEF